MTDRPIVFSAPMIRALLDGRKTQTRRVLKPQPRVLNNGIWYRPYPVLRPLHWAYMHGDKISGGADVRFLLGDRLWVREAFCPRLGYPAPIARPHYRADNDRQEWRSLWKPSIHMPRWASRRTLIVTDVRVQRLQDINEADAVAEGCAGFVSPDGEDGTSPREEFQDLWNSLHGPDAWDANPWVCALTFTVHQQNIDQMEAP